MEDYVNQMPVEIRQLVVFGQYCVAIRDARLPPVG
jgi:hypothetical protein